MAQENAQEPEVFNVGKQHENPSTSEDPSEEVPQQCLAFPQNQQIPASFLPGNPVTQFPLCSSRYYYQYYVPHATLPPPVFTPCGMYQNAIPPSNGNEYRFKENKRRRCRTVFTQDQLAQLESEFLLQHYPDNKLRHEMAIKTGLAEDRIQVWFQNRRAKERRFLEEKIHDHESHPAETSDEQSQNSTETINAIRTILKSAETTVAGRDAGNVPEVSGRTEHPEYEEPPVNTDRHGDANNNHHGVTMIGSHHTNKSLPVTPSVDVQRDVLSTHSLIAHTAGPISAGSYVSAQYLPRYMLGSFPMGANLETDIEAPVRCHIVTENQELAQLVVMDTGIQSSAGDAAQTFCTEAENQETEDHVITEL